jgi:CDP-paratose 2-epimerase
MRILITGGCGFIGSNIAIYLKKINNKNKIYCADNFYRKGSIENKKRLLKKDIVVIKCDIRNEKDLNKIPKFDLLIDCAADPSVATGYNNGLRYLIDTNLIGTLNCLNLVKRNKAKIIFLSSSRIYPFDIINASKYKIIDKCFFPMKNILGLNKNKGINENFQTTGLKTFYGYTKFSSEELIKEYCYAYNISYVINRCGVVAGPWQWGKIDQGFIVYWILCYLFNKKLNYIGYGGNGNQVRDVLNINDLVKLISLQTHNFEKFNNELFNIGGGQSNKISLYNLTKKTDEIFKFKKKISRIKKTRYGDIPYYVTDNTKIYEKCGWEPEISVLKTVEEIFDWIKINKILLKKYL